MKRQRISVLVLVLLYVAARPAFSQHWTTAEQEVMTAIEECETLWKHANEQASYEVWSDQCAASDETLTWWTGWSVPVSQREGRRGVATGLYSWGYERWDWTGMRPIRITLDGDYALVYYTVHWQGQDTDGKYNFHEAKRFEVWKTVNQRWKKLGGMRAPAD